MSDSNQRRDFLPPFVKGQILSAERMNRLQDSILGRVETDEAVNGPRVFELAEKLEPGEDADAYLLYYNKHTEEWKRFKTPDGNDYKFTISDPTGRIAGGEGEKGVCIRNKQSGMWVIPTAASGLIAARVAQQIPAKGNGTAVIMEWNSTTKKYDPGSGEAVDVYHVLQNYGLGPAETGADIFIQPGNDGIYELVQVTCPQGA